MFDDDFDPYEDPFLYDEDLEQEGFDVQPDDQQAVQRVSRMILIGFWMVVVFWCIVALMIVIPR
jgi:hypothetical protein